MKSINEAGGVLSRGETEVWYMRREWFSSGICGKAPNPNDLGRTHILLGKCEGKNAEELFASLQAENWSPNGEARCLIENLGLWHTSMSVGDVIVIDGKVLMCDVAGFKRL